MELEFLWALLSIVVIDIVLGGDNAIIIALASRRLPVEQRKKAILWGTVGAVGVRGAMAAVAIWLLKIPFLQLIGGLLLVWIAIKLLIQEEDHLDDIKAGNSLLEAIRTIIIADVVMGIDNVLAIAGAAHGSVLLVILGLAVSVPIIVWGSTLILTWMEKYPFIVYIGAGVLAWTAGSMIAEDRIAQGFLAKYIPYHELLIPIVILAAVMSVSRLLKRKPVAVSEK